MRLFHEARQHQARQIQHFQQFHGFARTCLAAFALLAFAACGERASAPGGSAAALGYERFNEANPLDQMDTHIYRLDNGLLVYLTENREEPRFYAEIAVRAGSKHDPADATGLAHYLEHLLFKGTRNLGTLDADAEAP